MDRMFIDENDIPRPVVTLRDQFAMAALAGIIVRTGNAKPHAAAEAYKYADEMLKARNEKPTE